MVKILNKIKNLKSSFKEDIWDDMPPIYKGFNIGMITAVTIILSNRFLDYILSFINSPVIKIIIIVNYVGLLVYILYKNADYITGNKSKK